MQIALGCDHMSDCLLYLTKRANYALAAPCLNSEKCFFILSHVLLLEARKCGRVMNPFEKIIIIIKYDGNHSF